MNELKDHQLLIIVGIVFIQLGLALPFWLTMGGYPNIPFGLSFLADGGVLLALGMLGWAFDVIDRAIKEDQLQKWIEASKNFTSEPTEYSTLSTHN